MKSEKRNSEQHGRRAFLKGLVAGGAGIVAASAVSAKKLPKKDKKHPHETLYHETPEIRKYYETLES
jgi:hypothetical protein